MTTRILKCLMAMEIGTESIALLGLIAIAFLSAADVMTGSELSIAPLHLVLVIFVGWHGGLALGLGLTCVAMVAMTLTGLYSGHPYSSDSYFYINTIGTASGLAATAAVTAGLRRALDRERALARTDPLTRIANRARFDDALAHELARHQRSRRPFAIAYIDCDGFKSVNDRFGHAVGDDVLCTIAETLAATLRGTDLPARLAGDEFAILLPEIKPGESLRIGERLRRRLAAAMQARDWPVTFSIVLAAFQKSPDSVAEAIARADALMDRAKADGKGQLVQETY